MVICMPERRHEALQAKSLMTNVDVDELLDVLFSVKPVIINQVEDLRC